MPKIAERSLVLGGMEGRDLDSLAEALVEDTLPDRWDDLRYVLEKALSIMAALTPGPSHASLLAAFLARRTKVE